MAFDSGSPEHNDFLTNFSRILESNFIWPLYNLYNIWLYIAGPRMAAIVFKTGTKYACNESNNLAKKVENCAGVTWLWFLDESRENKFSIIASIKRINHTRVQHFNFLSARQKIKGQWGNPCRIEFLDCSDW